MIVEVGFDNFIRLPLDNARLLRKLFGKYNKLTIFDIGACEGEDSVRYAHFFPLSEVHLFEPVPDNFNKIKKNIKRYNLAERVTINNIALSNTRENTIMYKSSGQPKDAKPLGEWDYGNKSSSLLKPYKTLEITPWLKFNDKIRVKTNTLDNYCQDNHISSIDLMHIDVQGAELMVLEGASKIINKVKAVWIEAESVELYEGQVLKDDLEAFMISRGFVKIVDTVNSVAGDQFYVKDYLLSKVTHNSSNLSIKDRYIIRKQKLYLVEPSNTDISLYVPQNHKWTFSENVFYEKNVNFWIEEMLNRLYTSRKKRPIFFDIGGNCGYYSLVAKDACSEVHIFEPSKTSSKTIGLNLKLNQVNNATIHNFGLSNHNGPMKFYTYSSSGNDSLVRRNIPKNHELKASGSYMVDVKTIDAIVPPLPLPDLIKIDVEGAELFVLEGGEKMLEIKSPSMIIEYSSGTSQDAGYKRKDIAELLRSKGYTIYGLSEDNESLRLIDINQRSDHKTSNILAVKDKDMLKWIMEFSS